MKVYVRCDGCKAEGEPFWIAPYIGLQFNSGGGGHHAPPAGWAELGTFLLCGACTEKVKGRLAEIVAGTTPSVAAGGPLK